MGRTRTQPARHDRDAVVRAALGLLDETGLPDLTMRRIAARLDVQPSALYWHFENKQRLLAAVADRILETARPPADATLSWRDAAMHEALAVRDALLAYRDGAEVVLSTRALGLGADAAYERLLAALSRGADERDAVVGATALLHLVLGDASLAQQRMQADSLGLLAADSSPIDRGPDDEGGLRAAVDLVLEGVARRAGVRG